MLLNCAINEHSREAFQSVIQLGQDYAPCPSHLAFSERRKNNVCHHTDLGLYCIRTATTLFTPNQHAAHSRITAFV
jgi:hypothetical protein